MMKNKSGLIVWLMKTVIGAWCVVLAACTAMAELVEYRDYDANTGTFTNAVRECTIVTSGTRTLANGWYAVTDTVTIPEGSRLAVQGTAHLILCDGATLSVEKPGRGLSAVKTTDATLVIYGQTSGMGALVATGGSYNELIRGGTGIGGDADASGGNVTINGGIVTAQGEEYAAGIGGGFGGSGGTITVNGGTVTVQGGYCGAGIGSGINGSSGTVTINGGVVTVQGGQEGAGIGGGRWGQPGMVTINDGVVTATGGDRGAGIGGGEGGAGGTVTINGGTVTATGCDNGVGIGCGYNGSGGTVTINGGMVTASSMQGDIAICAGIFTNEPQVGWLVPNYEVFANPDETTKGEYPYAVLGGDISYLDWDENQRKMTNAVVRAGHWTEVTADTRTLADGVWYVVRGNVVLPDNVNLTVNGSSRLVLCDGATLTVETRVEGAAAVSVGEDASLAIYGQSEGTGCLTAKGGFNGAGIGGGYNVAGGAVTINGGTVTATGGDRGAGIGSGYDGTGGTVTINGGTVSAQCGFAGAGIGGGYYGGGCKVTINGGTVTAMGRDDTDGIGNGKYGSGGVATITGGAIKASSIGGDVEISGGIFNVPIREKWCADHFAPSVNLDPDTRAVYRYAVVPGWVVTVGHHPRTTAVWTSGDGTLTNAVDGVRFLVPDGTENVVVCYTVLPDYVLEGGAAVNLGTVTEDIVFGVGNAFAEPRIYCTLGDVSYLDWNGSQMTNAVLSKYDYVLVTAGTGEMEDGWYVAARDVECTNIKVKGSVQLVVMDGCELKASAGKSLAGVEVSEGNRLVIYGQMNGTGKLTAAGGMYAAGIGGCEYGSGGTITINGGTVTATSGAYGAGIGGGSTSGTGGTITINGGTVTATSSGLSSVGIGTPNSSKVVTSGTVTINGGTVTASAVSPNAAGIGVGGANGGTVTINGGTVTAIGGHEFSGKGVGIGIVGNAAGGGVTINGGIVTAKCEGEGVDIGGLLAGNTVAVTGGAVKASRMNGDITISGGIFGTEPENGWIVADSIKVENPDEATKAEYPWAVVSEYCTVTIGNFPRGIVEWTSGDWAVTNVIGGTGFEVTWGTENVKVIFTAKPGYELVGETVVDLGTVTADIKFGSGSGCKLPSVRTLPVEYVDADGVVRVKDSGEFTKVTASTKKLADGKWYAVIDDVTLANSLPVEGSAHLILCDWATLAITNSTADAAIAVGSGASLTIYGQTADTGRLAVSGGNAGIGGKTSGVCGAIAIHGGTISASAMANKYAAGIGSGALGSGGSVTITGGRITAQGGTGAEDIGSGANAKSPCAVAISGGIFARPVQDAWLADDCAAITNQDAETATEYPWAVVPYPVAWPEADAAVKAKFGDWRKGVGASADLSTDDAQKAFLLNVAVTGIKELKIESIEVDDEGYATIVVSAPGAFFFDRINLGEINGILHVQAGKTLETMTPKAVTYWTTTSGKAVIKVRENFIRAAIGFKTPDVAADTLHGAAGVRALPETGTAYGPELCNAEGKANGAPS